RERIATDSGADGVAVVYAGFDFGAFVVIVPGGNVEVTHAVVIVIVALLERIDPGLATLLVHDAARPPLGLNAVEAFEAVGPDQIAGVSERRGKEGVESGASALRTDV